MKIALTDLETTGLNPYKHEIIELGCVIFDSKTFEIYGKMNFKIKPEHIESADPKALEVNGYNEEEWQDAMSLHQALNFFSEATEGCTFCAHNAIFDWNFLESAFNEKKITHKLLRHKICTVSVAWAKLPHDKLSSWSLKTLCTYLGIPPEDKVHRAINGVMSTYQVYCKLMEIK